MDKKLLRYAGNASALLAFICLLLAVSIFTGLVYSVFVVLTFAFMLVSSTLSKTAGKMPADERQIRVSRKANAYGTMALMGYCIIVALLAKENPVIISVPLALGGALLVQLAITFLARQVLLTMPDTDA